MASTIENLEGKTHLDLLKLGTREFWLRNYSNAVTYLVKSSELLVAEHNDDRHESLGIVYLFYGKALLELARESGDPLGDAVPKEIGLEPEEEEGGSEVEGDESLVVEENAKDGEVNKEEVDKEIKENGADASASKEPKENGTDKTNGSKVEDIETEDSKNEDDSIVEDNEDNDDADDSKIADEGDEVDEELDADGESVEKSPEEDEPSDLQLAWEVLELAKIILEKKGQEFIEDYADCLISLGEVSLESENFDSAIADITTGLNIQKEIWTKSDDFRKLAETYYKLGMALSAHNQIEEGIKNYEICMNLVKEKLKVLEAKAELGVSDKKEIKDIKALIPELEDKIADLKSFKDEAPQNVDEDEPMVSSPEKKATNITHLVRRKRKLEEITDEVAASVTKKAAPSPSSDKTETSSDKKEPSPGKTEQPADKTEQPSDKSILSLDKKAETSSI